MDLFSELLVFAKVVETGGFSAAAAQLGMAKSSVSKKVAALESRYNVRLIYRTTRKLRISEDGQALYEHCRRLQETFDAARSELEQLPAEPRGRLFIGAPPLFSKARLLPLFLEFMRTYPEVEVALQLEDSYANMLEEGFDALIRMGEQPDSSMIAQPISSVRAIVCASPTYFERRGIPTSPSDLTGHDCLVWQREQQVEKSPEWFFYRKQKRKQQRIRQPVKGVLVSNDTESLAYAACEAMGIAMLPDFLVEERLRSGELIAILKDFEFPPVPIYLMYAHRKHQPAKLRVFVEFMRSRMGME